MTKLDTLAHGAMQANIISLAGFDNLVPQETRMCWHKLKIWRP